jgi:hypothetical protein
MALAASAKVHSGNHSDVMTAAEIASARVRIAAVTGVDTANISDDEIERIVTERARRFIDEAPMTA